MKITEVRENLTNIKTRTKKKQEDIVISQNFLTQLFNILMTKFKYSWIRINENIGNDRQITNY